MKIQHLFLLLAVAGSSIVTAEIMATTERKTFRVNYKDISTRMKPLKMFVTTEKINGFFCNKIRNSISKNSTINSEGNSFNLSNQNLLDLGENLASYTKHSGIKFVPRINSKFVDDIGRTHITFDQYCYGRRVIDAVVTVHFNQNDSIYEISSTFDPDVSMLSAMPEKSEEDAVNIMLNDIFTDKISSIDKAAILAEKPEIVIISNTLAYLIKPKAQFSDNFYYVNAITGEILLKKSQVAFYMLPISTGTDATITGNVIPREGGGLVTINGLRDNLYYLYSRTNLWGVYDARVSPAIWCTNSTSSWGSINPAAISAAKNIESTQKVVKTFLNRNSFDNNGTVMEIELVNNTGFGPYNSGNTLVFPIQEYGGWITPSLDVIAHEYAHTLTSYTSQLNYVDDEPGALNEGFSDIFGCMVEQMSQPDPDPSNTYPKWQNGRRDWYISEDWAWTDASMTTPWISRDLQNPLNTMCDLPSYYQGTNWHALGAPVTRGGYDFKHVNCTVVGHVYYLLVTGGSGINDGHPYGPIKPMGLIDASHVVMDAFLVYYANGGANCTFNQARQNWLTAAEYRGLDVMAVAQAWAACGIGTANSLSGTTVNDTRNISGDYIEIGNNSVATVINNGANVTAHGTDKIIIKPEFVVNRGANFRAYLP